MNRKLLSLVFATAIAGLFLLLVLFSPSGFNYIPYLIYESIWRGGSGESTFIRIFDLLFAILLFWVSFRLFSWILKKDRI